VFVGDFIRLHALSRPREVAFVVGDHDEEITYGDVNARINRTASALRASGIGKGDRVAVLGKNSIEYLQLYFATAKLGAILVPLNFWHRAPEHEYTIGDAEPSLFFVEPGYREVSAAAVAAAGDGLEVLDLPGPDGGSEGWDAFLTRATDDAEPQVELAPEDPHMILYTSGTTGRPKGAVLSHGRTVDDGMAMTAALRVRTTDVFMNYFPPFHVGNWDHMKTFLIGGARVVLMREFDAGAVVRGIPHHGVTVLLGVPTMLHALLEHPDFDATPKDSVRLIYYGAYDPSGIMDRIADAFGAREGRTQMGHCYGLTEGGPFVCWCPPEDVFERWGSIGRPLFGIEVALLDDLGAPVEPGEPGEICVRGPRMSGYWRKPEATAAALEGDWLHTGDIAIADDDGFLRIVDRKKDMIRSGGQNVYSKEVEDCLLEHPAVLDCAVIGLPDPVYEERVCAVLVARDPDADEDALREEIIGFVRSRLAGYNTPRAVEFVSELPKTAVGKTQKNLLRERFGSMFDAPAQAGRK
jgi:acyl-CoA synthetase (AMP-forming)/AMP-acid ligase II